MAQELVAKNLPVWVERRPVDGWLRARLDLYRPALDLSRGDGIPYALHSYNVRKFHDSQQPTAYNQMIHEHIVPIFLPTPLLMLLLQANLPLDNKHGVMRPDEWMSPVQCAADVIVYYMCVAAAVQVTRRSDLYRLRPAIEEHDRAVEKHLVAASRLLDLDHLAGACNDLVDGYAQVASLYTVARIQTLEHFILKLARARDIGFHIEDLLTSPHSLDANWVGAMHSGDAQHVLVKSRDCHERQLTLGRYRLIFNREVTDADLGALQWQKRTDQWRGQLCRPMLVVALLSATLSNSIAVQKIADAPDLQLATDAATHLVARFPEDLRSVIVPAARLGEPAPLTDGFGSDAASDGDDDPGSPTQSPR